VSLFLVAFSQFALLLGLQKTTCKNSYGSSKCSEVKVGMHRLLLFMIVRKPYLENSELPYHFLLYADDLVVIAETEHDLIKTCLMS